MHYEDHLHTICVLTPFLSKVQLIITKKNVLDKPIACLEGAYCSNHVVDHITNQIKLNKINRITDECISSIYKEVLLQFTDYEYMVSSMVVNQFLCILFSLLLHYVSQFAKVPCPTFFSCIGI